MAIKPQVGFSPDFYESSVVLCKQYYYTVCVPRRDWFDTYESCHGGTVIVGNNAPCKIAGIGFIRLRTSDRRKFILTRVRHVPTLGKNLISLGSLDDLGYNGVFSD